MRCYLHVGVGNDGAVDDWIDAVIPAENEVHLISKFLQSCLLQLRIVLLFIFIFLFILLLLLLFVPFLLFHKQL